MLAKAIGALLGVVWLLALATVVEFYSPSPRAELARAVNAGPSNDVYALGAQAP